MGQSLSINKDTVSSETLGDFRVDIAKLDAATLETLFQKASTSDVASTGVLIVGKSGVGKTCFINTMWKALCPQLRREIVKSWANDREHDGEGTTALTYTSAESIAELNGAHSWLHLLDTRGWQQIKFNEVHVVLFVVFFFLRSPNHYTPLLKLINCAKSSVYFSNSDFFFVLDAYNGPPLFFFSNSPFHTFLPVRVTKTL